MERLKNIPVGAGDDVRLEDLGAWDRFEALCARCRKRTVPQPAALGRRWPGGTRIVDLEGRLRCRACGNRDGNRLGLRRVKRD